MKPPALLWWMNTVSPGPATTGKLGRGPFSWVNRRGPEALWESWVRLGSQGLDERMICANLRTEGDCGSRDLSPGASDTY